MRHQVRRAELAAADAESGGHRPPAGLGAGLATGVATVALGVAALGSTWLAVGARRPGAGAVLALVPLAVAETVDGLRHPALRPSTRYAAAYGLQ